MNRGLDSSERRLEALAGALGGLRVPVAPGEYDLHDMISKALIRAGYEPRHEVALGPRRRIDFVVDRLGIEVKKGKPARRALMEQAARYLESAELEGLLVVVERSASLPGHLAGKPVKVLGLNRLWGVALP